MNVAKRFVAMHNFPNWTPPTRIYVHRAGFPEVWGSANYQRGLALVCEQAQCWLNDPIGRDAYYQFLLGIMWGSKENGRMLDLFGFNYGPGSDWPGNPDVSGMVFGNVPQSNGAPLPPLTCGDSLILLGAEERHRRSCTNLVEYTLTPPDISHLFSGIKRRH